MSKGRKTIYIRTIVLAIYLFLIGITGTTCAQDTIPVAAADTIASANFFTGDDMAAPLSDSILAVFDSLFMSNEDGPFTKIGDSSIASGSGEISKNKKVVIAKNADSFKPNPKTAYRIAAIFPGFGQMYNRQYWKLPIVYGGLMGCAYAITWNNKTYQDYKTAYFDIVTDSKNDPRSENPETWSSSWQDFVAANADPATRLHDRSFHDNLKRGKDYFRRYRDLSIIIGVGLYLIFVADSYVDAQMFDFDVSPDLSFRFTPEFRPETLTGSRSFGINVCMTF